MFVLPHFLYMDTSPVLLRFGIPKCSGVQHLRSVGLLLRADIIIRVGSCIQARAPTMSRPSCLLQYFWFSVFYLSKVSIIVTGHLFWVQSWSTPEWYSVYIKLLKLDQERAFNFLKHVYSLARVSASASSSASSGIDVRPASSYAWMKRSKVFPVRSLPAFNERLWRNLKSSSDTSFFI